MKEADRATTAAPSGAVETGGTTTRVLVGNAAGEFAARTAFPTRDPVETVARIVAFLAPHHVAAVGLAAFGPIDVDPDSRDYGMLLSTPKSGWSGFPLRAELARALAVPVRVDSDVNAAALAEQEAARAAGVDARTLVYVTVGTGIGVGLALDGRAHHGTLHPEAGHLLVRRVPGDTFAGLCPFHRDCLEGLASGPALAARTGDPPRTLPPDHPALALEADYLAQLLIAIVGFLAPHQIVVGGGVLKSAGLLERVRTRARELTHGYSPLLSDADASARAIVAPRLGADSGLLGALRLATRGD